MTVVYSFKICPVCGKEFSFREAELKHRTPKYCSLTCYHSARGKRGKYKKKSETPATIVSSRELQPYLEVMCETCGKKFLSRRRAKLARFCSRQCLYDGMRGPKSADWKGGRLVNSEGYVLIYAPDNPSSHDGYIKEHRLVMEQTLGRRLSKEESVHHINGVRSDNRPDNLQLTRSYHGKGVCYVCADCGSHNIIPVEK